MKYKAPRDPNTPSGFEIPLRRMDPSENWPCHVGEGESHEPAIEAHDDGSGGEFLVCAKHLPQLHAIGKLFAEMTPAQIYEFVAFVVKKEEG